MNKNMMLLLVAGAGVAILLFMNGRNPLRKTTTVGVGPSTQNPARGNLLGRLSQLLTSKTSGIETLDTIQPGFFSGPTTVAELNLSGQPTGNIISTSRLSGLLGHV